MNIFPVEKSRKTLFKGIDLNAQCLSERRIEGINTEQVASLTLNH